MFKHAMEKLAAIRVVYLRSRSQRIANRLANAQARLMELVPDSGYGAQTVNVFGHTVMVIHRDNRKVNEKLLNRLYGDDAHEAYVIERKFKMSAFDHFVKKFGIADYEYDALVEVTPTRYVTVTVNKE